MHVRQLGSNGPIRVENREDIRKLARLWKLCDSAFNPSVMLFESLMPGSHLCLANAEIVLVNPKFRSYEMSYSIWTSGELSDPDGIRMFGSRQTAQALNRFIAELEDKYRRDPIEGVESNRLSASLDFSSTR